MTSKSVNLTRRAQLDSTDIDLDTPSTDVDHGLVKDQGLALVGGTAGIETEGPTASVKAALADEKFMAEFVEAQFHDPATEHDPQFVEGGVNGERFCFARDSNRTYKVRRSHLGVIASAKMERLVQRRITLPDGSMGYEEKMVLQPLYPFSVIYDANPKGGTWLRQVLQRS